jgi:hypothetical protein
VGADPAGHLVIHVQRSWRNVAPNQTGFGALYARVLVDH